MSDGAEFEQAYEKIRLKEQPVVYFPYGVRIGVVDGEPVLIPLTPQEFREAYQRKSGVLLTDEEIELRSCGMRDNWCSGDCPNDGDINNVGCHKHYDGSASYCTCYLH